MKTPELILLQLKTLGPHSAKMLAEHLDITPMGIRQHLQSLEKRELVCYEEARTKVGRPTRYWSLTHEGHSRFADGHDTLATALLGSAHPLFGAEGVEQLLGERGRKALSALCRRAVGRDLSSSQACPAGASAAAGWLYGRTA
jgi:predicted ArsR family transcriptional regulator